MSKFHDILVEKNLVVCSTIFTLLTALISAATEAFSEKIPKNAGFVQPLSFNLFLVGVCIIFIQLVILNYTINNTHNSSHKIITKIEDYVNRKQNLLLPEDSNSLSDEVWNLIDSGKVFYITIICYGTSAFGGIIDKLAANSKEIKTNILVCSPESKYILMNSDRGAIKKLIETRKSDHIVFSESPIPSTIRACVLYDKNHAPIWSSIQTYYYNHVVERHSFDYQKSFTIIARIENSGLLLTGMEAIIAKEFYRLKYFSYRQEGLNDNQINAIRRIEENGEITKTQYCQINNSSGQVAEDELKDLCEKQYLQAASKGRKTIYELSEKCLLKNPGSQKNSATSKRTTAPKKTGEQKKNVSAKGKSKKK